MGNYFASSMKKNQELMMEKQRQTQQQMQKTQMAMQIARSREFFLWISTFYVTAAFGLFNGFRKSKKPAFLAPLVPLTFVTLYYADLAYGNKLHRIRMEAEHIMAHETYLLELPRSLPRESSVKISSLGLEEKKKTD